MSIEGLFSKAKCCNHPDKRTETPARTNDMHQAGG